MVRKSVQAGNKLVWAGTQVIPLSKSLYWQCWGVLCKPPLPWPYGTGTLAF